MQIQRNIKQVKEAGKNRRKKERKLMHSVINSIWLAVA